MASKVTLKCMLFADVSWPANRKMTIMTSD